VPPVKNGDYAEDMAMEMLATTISLPDLAFRKMTSDHVHASFIYLEPIKR